ncbi:protein phosphatase 2C domain-containing protein [Ignavigranum ruoffiae]|uniref:protein phosphatase 2C domain-containing protein n=1 Tax=Ignavigranum ruoffiae TaxID=89093 RepID=UPI002047FE7C|nr:protein phosphatase 2C domain-containing protein [Ignavigranum ruoffiae]UPQ86326.1 protein phosphatase 2C domain-containing protein [Ignavigranum ruoffiae]
MKILEKFIAGKNNIEECEDALVISENFIAVIDGVTSKSPFRWQGKTTGKIASELIKNIIQENQEESLQEIICRINAEINLFNKNYLQDLDIRRYGLQAVMAVYSVKEKQVWLIGDCMALIAGQQYQLAKKSDVVLAEFRSLVNHIQLKKSNRTEEEYFLKEDMGRELILPWIVDSNLFANIANNEWGYAVLNGEDIPPSLIKKINVPDKMEVVLSSDGYFELTENLVKTEAKLSSILKDNPYLYKTEKSTKGIKRGQDSFDDRTYIRFITGS